MGAIVFAVLYVGTMIASTFALLVVSAVPDADGGTPPGADRRHRHVSLLILAVEIGCLSCAVSSTAFACARLM